MLHKTKGIVINYISYRETSVIVKIYTEAFGVQSYIENGVRSSKGKNKIALFQPLTLLELVVYHDQKKDLHRISEIKCPNPLTGIPFEVYKTTIGIFLTEILNKTLKEHTENEALFFFLYHSILTLDHAKIGIENFHLKFLAKLALYLGFIPENAAEIEEQFREAGIGIPIDENTRIYLNALFNSEYEETLHMNKTFRNHLLDILLAFYKLHQAEFGELRSLTVLKEVLS